MRLAPFFAVTMMAIAPAAAGEAEVAAAQATVGNQIEAFRAGDDARAYGYAAPGIRRIFPTLDAFMAMVKGAYQPVYKPQRYSFGPAEEPGADTVLQRVQLTGPDGKDYEALYSVQRQPDGTYLINGVSLRAAGSLST